MAPETHTELDVSSNAAARRRELVALGRSRGLRYPIRSKSEFVRQMTAIVEPVRFRDGSYDAAFASALIPDFFFPVESEDDLVDKALELLMARGMLPLEQAHVAGDR